MVGLNLPLPDTAPSHNNPLAFRNASTKSKRNRNILSLLLPHLLPLSASIWEVREMVFRRMSRHSFYLSPVVTHRKRRVQSIPEAYILLLLLLLTLPMLLLPQRNTTRTIIKPPSHPSHQMVLHLHCVICNISKLALHLFKWNDILNHLLRNSLAPIDYLALTILRSCMKIATLPSLPTLALAKMKFPTDEPKLPYKKAIVSFYSVKRLCWTEKKSYDITTQTCVWRPEDRFLVLLKVLYECYDCLWPLFPPFLTIIISITILLSQMMS